VRAARYCCQRVDSQIYLIDKGDREPGITDSIGEQNLIWATDSADGLKHFEEFLK